MVIPCFEESKEKKQNSNFPNILRLNIDGFVEVYGKTDQTSHQLKPKVTFIEKLEDQKTYPEERTSA